MITLDKHQRSLQKILDGLIIDLQPKNLLSQAKNIIGLTQKKDHGIYIYGSVGRGKTMLAKKFYDQFDGAKTSRHFQYFMISVHQQLQLLRQQHEGSAQIIEVLVAEYYNKYDLIFIDEFEVKDIADAMLMERFFSALTKSGCFVIITSNTAPHHLYMDGLQRENFIPFIHYVMNKFKVFSLDGEQDYRRKEAEEMANKFIETALDNKKSYEQDAAAFQKIAYGLLGDNHWQQVSLQLFNREISFRHCFRKILFVSQHDLINDNFAAADYIEICTNFNTILIRDFKQLNDQKIDQVIRFIKFVDHAYQMKVILFIHFLAPMEKIYNGKLSQKEFKRTLSRLNEMKQVHWGKS